jgi:hypothetical protein
MECEGLYLSCSCVTFLFLGKYAIYEPVIQLIIFLFSMTSGIKMLNCLFKCSFIALTDHALLFRREVFPDGVLYASKESHYSVFKAARMYRMECVKIDTLISGEIDCTDFEKKLLQNKDKPAIINVNIGVCSFHFYFMLCHCVI